MSTKLSMPQSQIVALEEVENSSSETTLSMKDCVSQFIETSVGNTAVTVSNIHSVWEKIVGQDVYQHAKVRHIRNSVLYVSVDHPVWSTQLEFMAGKIIDELNSVLNDEKISSIHISIKRN